METVTRDAARALLPVRPADGHKGVFGHVAIAAGAAGFVGAARLACRAAERSGVGLVTLCTPEPVAAIAAAALSETMVAALPPSASGTLGLAAAEALIGRAARCTALAVGPGIGCDEHTAAFVACVAAACALPMVLDADGLNALARAGGAARTGPWILTPHPGEMARLLGTDTAAVQADRPGAALRAARRFGAIAVLKGHGTVVAAPDGRIARNTTGNDGMATGGTGDVLAGLLGGLLAQGMDAFDAARLGVFVHGLAGDLAAAAKTARGMIASDLIDALPAAWRALERA